jgi:hypothetical protein
MFIHAEDERFYLKLVSDAWRSCRPYDLRPNAKHFTANWGKGQSWVTASPQIDPGMKQPNKYTNSQTNTQTPPSGKFVHLVKNFDESDETQIFVAVFTKARY